jgi:hypothetical protein
LEAATGAARGAVEAAGEDEATGEAEAEAFLEVRLATVVATGEDICISGFEEFFERNKRGNAVPFPAGGAVNFV